MRVLVLYLWEPSIGQNCDILHTYLCRKGKDKTPALLLQCFWTVHKNIMQTNEYSNIISLNFNSTKVLARRNFFDKHIIQILRITIFIDWSRKSIRLSSMRNNWNHIQWYVDAILGIDVMKHIDLQNKRSCTMWAM